MYQILLPLHSIVRWLLIAALLFCLLKSINGLIRKSRYGKLDNIFRSITSGVSHLQLIIGIVLYFKSPITTYFRTNTAQAIGYADVTFFGLFHICFMVVSILLLTIGASKAKRAKTDSAKHKQIVLWFGISAVLILLAIPWPFSPYIARPFIRLF